MHQAPSTIRTPRTIPLYGCPFRVWTNQWFTFWFNPMTHIRSWRAFYQRGRRGWANSDCWALDEYLTGWMGDAVHHWHRHSHGAWERSPKGQRIIAQIIQGWDSAIHVTDQCDCYDGRVTDLRDWERDHTEYHRRRWHRGIHLWGKHFFKFWW